jgi:hypothetical protein
MPQSALFDLGSPLAIALIGQLRRALSTKVPNIDTFDVNRLFELRSVYQATGAIGTDPLSLS